MGNSCSSCILVVVVVVVVAVAVAVAFVVLVVACVGNTGLVPPAGPPKPLSVMPMEAMKGATEFSHWLIGVLDSRLVVKSHLSIEGRNYPIG